MRTVAVIGASGRQGGAQVRQLSKAGFKARAISRRPDPFYGEAIENTEVVAADLYDEQSLSKAFEGADAVFYTHPLRARVDRAHLVGSVGRAAKAVGVGRVVWNTSGHIPDRPGDSEGAYANNTAGINALWRSGAPGTVFGSVLFMDNLLTNWARPFIVNEDRYVYPHRPDLESNWISLDDVAKIMIASLDRPDMEGAWMNIGGPERLKPPQVAEALSEALGRPIRYDPCTPQEFGRYLAAAFGDEMGPEERTATESSIAAFYEYNNNAPISPFAVDTDAMLARMPIELETLGQWARRQEWRNTNTPRPPAG